MIQMTPFQIAANWSVVGAAEAIKQKCIDAGWTLVDDHSPTSSSRNIVFQPLPSGHADFSRVFLVLSFNPSAASLTLTASFAENWSTGTHSSTKQTSSTRTTVLASSTSQPINCAIFQKSGEVYAVSGANAANVNCAGILHLSNLPSYWPPETHAPWLSFSPSSAIHISGAGKSIWSTTTASLLTADFDAPPTLLSQNPIDGKREVVGGPIPIYTQQGYIGTTDVDFGYVAASGLAFFDTLEVQAGVEVWTLVEAGSRSMAFRTT